MVNAVHWANLDAGAALATFILINRLTLAVVHHIYFRRTHIDAFLTSGAFLFIHHNPRH
jgi:hypothetical protein